MNGQDGEVKMKQHNIKGWFPAFLVVTFMILGVPVLINLVYWPDIGVWSMLR